MDKLAASLLNVSKSFGEHKALSDLTFNLKQGKITGLIGADGAGKTTLLRILIGLLLPNEGTISVLGLDPKYDRNSINDQIGYMPQKFGLYEDLTVMENLKLYADLKNVPHNFTKLLEFTTLLPFQDRLAGALSGGMKQKLGLACTLLGQPKLLLLDEPSVGVDPISRRELFTMIKAMITPDTTVLWSTAYLDEAHNFDVTVVLDQGRVIFDGDPNEIASNTKEFEERIIELMGGEHKGESLIAKNYQYTAKTIEFPVEALALEKKYGDFYAVKNNSFKIKKGEIFGLLGPNGAGKSTSFKMMCGLAKATHGTAKIMGIDISKDPERARANLGYMAQKFSLYADLTVYENLEFFAQIYGIRLYELKSKINNIIDIFDLGNYKNSKAGDLPLGLKQRLSMATALIHNPPILFLDEPTSGVDIITRRDFWKHIIGLSKKGVTILVTTHFMDEAEYCHRISLFYHGETIAVGTPSELKQRVHANSMEEAFIKLIEESENR